MIEWNPLNIWASAVILVVSVICMYVLCRLPKKEGQIPKRKTFLEEVLEADIERRGASGSYTWDDLQRDLHDPNLTFNEILDKCGGQLPQRPKEPDVKKQEQSNGEPKDDERQRYLGAWFEDRAKENLILKVVKPTPQPPPVVTLRGQPVRCPYCQGSGRHQNISATRFYTSMVGDHMIENYQAPGHPKALPGGNCRRCQGHGYVIVSGG